MSETPLFRRLQDDLAELPTVNTAAELAAATLRVSAPLGLGPFTWSELALREMLPRDN